MAKKNLFYRLRSLDRLLGENWQENDGKNGELEKQEIYFATLSELNDPMEGFSNIVFQGNSEVWHNFFKDYLVYLEKMFCMNLSLNKNSKFIDLSTLPFYYNYQKNNTFFFSKFK